MKKTLIAFLLLCSVQLFSQSRQGTVEYDKTQVPCYIIDLPYSTSVAEDAIKDRFKKMGVNGKEKKGFMEFRNVIIPEISSNPVDALIKIERPSRKEKDQSVLYMIVNPVGLTNTTSNTPVQDFATGSNTFLVSLAGNTQDYSLELEIKNQDDEVKKAEKKYKNLVDDADDMQKKLKKLQDDIADNIKKQQQQSAEVQKQKDALVQMMGRRRKQG